MLRRSRFGCTGTFIRKTAWPKCQYFTMTSPAVLILILLSWVQLEVCGQFVLCLDRHRSLQGNKVVYSWPYPLYWCCKQHFLWCWPALYLSPKGMHCTLCTEHLAGSKHYAILIASSLPQGGSSRSSLQCRDDFPLETEICKLHQR